MTILVSDLCKNSSLVSLIVALLCGVHAWIARHGSSLLCVNVQPFCPMWRRFNWSSYKQLMLLKCRNHTACSTWIVIHDLRFLMVTISNRGKLIWHPYSRVVAWYIGSGLKAQNMTGIRAQRKRLRAQKNGIRDHKAFEPESGIRFITRSKNLLSQYFSA